MHNNVKSINYIKEDVNQLIQDNLYREVKPETNHKIPGIYMIYIDNLTSDKIVPIYIGQSRDIQKRYKQHFEEILALNRLSCDEYNKYFFSKSISFYEGRFKACKIFKYMIENKCTLQAFRMVVLEEVEKENLDEKEQEYLQRLLPSFFGFNQLNSYLKQLEFRLSNSEMSNSEINDYLNILQEDIKGIASYYKYGFTRFNFEHSMPKDISNLLNENQKLDGENLLKFDKVKLNLDKLCKQYISNFEEKKRLSEKINKLYKVYKKERDEFYEALDLLKSDLSNKFKELKYYSEKAKENFIYSIVYKANPKYKNLFLEYLDSKNSKLDFYEIFEKQIKEVNKKLEEKEVKNINFLEASDLYEQIESERRTERYKLIFPSIKFDCFSLKDRAVNFFGKVDEENDNLLNTCHIIIYISNNAINRSLEISKEPFIIRFDYCFIDNEGKKTENVYYIDNETTRNCQVGIEYIEKDFYNMWAIRKEKFKISSVINNEIDNSFISVLAEYKHGINDYTIKDKNLIKLSAVINEIQELINDNTRFNLLSSESFRCIERCMINERLQNNIFVEKLVTNKLPKIKKKRKTSIKKTKNVAVDNPIIDNKVKRAESYKQKVLIKSDNAIKVLNYVSSKEKVKAQCNICGYEWEIRSDHLLSRPHCPSCRKTTIYK